MIEDNMYCVRRLRVFRRVFVTADVPVTADWVEHHAGRQNRSEEAGRYLSDEFNAGWIEDVGFLEGGDGKGVRKNAGEG